MKNVQKTLQSLPFATRVKKALPLVKWIAAHSRAACCRGGSKLHYYCSIYTNPSRFFHRAMISKPDVTKKP
jgi:hypothetical protein